jgi:hypothetical protein
VLETHVALEPARDFKLALAERLGRSGRLLEGAFAHLKRGSGARLLVRAYALTLGLWQLMQTSSRWRDMADLPGMEVFRADYPKELELALVAYWSGALQAPDRPRRGK